MPARGIYLIGFSGTGKSTIAQAVAAALGWPAHDLDRLVVEQSGMTIPLIFEREGEAGFRARETEALRTASESAPFVVATGGGAPMRVENRRLMASTGWVVALEGRPELIHARLRQQLQRGDPDAPRPLLDAADPLDRIRSLKRARQSVYALADWTVHTDRLTPGQVADEVVRAVKLLEETQEPPAAFDVPAEPVRQLDPPSSAPRPSPRPSSRALPKRLDVRGRLVADGRTPLVCAPLVGRERQALLEEARAVAAKRPDLVEWRADFFGGVASVDEVLSAARAIRAAVGETPVLFTLRSVTEGGQPVPLSPRQVLDLHEAACASGAVDLVDFELSNAADDVRRVREASRRAGVKLVLSFHDFERTPPADVLRRTFHQAERAGADVAKVAVMPRSPEDVLALLSVTMEADRQLRIPLASVSMGAQGSLTRVCGWMFGSALTFAVGQGSSAPGQLPIEDLRSAIEVLRRAAGAVP